MNYNEYQELASRTHNPSLSDLEARSCYAMGLAGEAGEAADYVMVSTFTAIGHIDHQKVVKELGDVHWYLVMTAKVWDILAEDIIPVAPSHPDAWNAATRWLGCFMGTSGAAGMACDYVKKVLYHGHAFDRDRMKHELGRVRWYVNKAADVIGASEDEVLTANVAKLQARYPDGFTKQASQQRAADDL